MPTDFLAVGAAPPLCRRISLTRLKNFLLPTQTGTFFIYLCILLKSCELKNVPLLLLECYYFCEEGKGEERIQTHHPLENLLLLFLLLFCCEGSVPIAHLFVGYAGAVDDEEQYQQHP